MRILIDGRLYGLENAGLGRYLINLVDGLSKSDSKNNYVILLRKKYFDTLVLPRNWKKVRADFRHYSFTEQFKLPLLIQKEKPDLVHFPHFNIPIFYFGKFVVTIHDMLMHESTGVAATTLPRFQYFIKRLGYRFVFDSAVRRANKIIVPSRAVKDELVKFYLVPEQKVFVTYEGVQVIKDSKEKMPVKGSYFVYTGNAYPHKNIKRLIEAMVSLNKKSDQMIKLIISSSRGIFTQRLEKMINDYSAESCVKLLGFVPDEKLPDLYKNSLGFVYPSLSEGFGLQGLEAMTLKTLLLASDIAVFKEIYQDNAIYFNPKNSESITDALEEVSKMNPLERDKRIKKAEDFAKRYSWDKMAKETLNIYNSII